MTLLDSFTKPGWQNRKPEVRKAAIDTLDDQAVLLELVRNDPDQGVRAHALARISTTEALDELIESLEQPLQGQAKAQRLKQLLPDAGKLSAIADDEVLVRIASLADDSGLVTACIEQVTNPETRLNLASHHPIAKIRLTAAQGIKDIDQLKELALQSKSKDKSVYRHCKERLDACHAAEQAAVERQQQIQHMADDVRKLSAGVDSPEFRARFLTLEHRWPQLKEHADAVYQRRIEDDLEICAKRLEKLTSAIEAEKIQQAEVLEANHTLEQIIHELEIISISDLVLTEPKAVRDFAKSLDGIEDRWLATLQHVHPSPEQTLECKKHLTLWRSVAQAAKRVLSKKQALDSLHEETAKLDKTDYMAHHKLLNKVEKELQKLSWPESHKEATPDAVVQLHQLQGRLQNQLENLKKQEKKTLEQLESTFDELRKELDDNHFKNADRLHNKVRKLLRTLGPEHQDRFHNELRPLTARLSEVHDWQGFAIEPKKVELCERMAALVDSEEATDTLAAKIKVLQDDWKKLGTISPRRDQELWRRFHTAAEQAYKPCKEAFAEQGLVRKENLRQRMALVAQLVDYDKRMAWPGSAEITEGSAVPDWRMVQKTLDTARAAFNNIKPVDGKGERKSRKALQKICDRIYGHIKDEYERNIARKRELISQARAFIELEDLREAINGAKDIQREWKNVGLTPRQVDRGLWKDFRSACDGVFARLDEQRKQQNAARSEQLAQVKADKNERMELAKQRALKEQQRWPHLLELFQAFVMKAEDEAKATELWEKEGDIPKGVDKAALKAWWESGPDDKLTEDVQREACIAMEILLGVDSPVEDKEARMAYQMKRLLEGLGSQQGEHQERLIQQVNEFIAMRPQAAWLDRFCCGGKINPAQK